MKQIKFLVEEYHRGKWQPLMIEKKGKTVQKRVVITPEEADAMNVHKEDYKLRYVEAKNAKNIEVVDPVVETGEDINAIRAEYQELFNKKPFGGWDADTLKEKIANKKSEQD